MHPSLNKVLSLVRLDPPSQGKVVSVLGYLLQDIGLMLHLGSSYPHAWIKY